MIPVEAGPVQDDPDPSAGTVIGRLEIGLGLRFDEVEKLIHATGLDQYSDVVAAVMLVVEIGEILAGFFASRAPPGGAVAFPFMALRKCESQLAHLLEQEGGVVLPPQVFVQDPRVQLVLGKSHAIGETFGGFACTDSHFHLAQDFACIEFGCHQMHRDTAMAVPGVDRALVSVEARIFGQEGGVDVEHPSCPAIDETVGEDAHISG